MFIYLFLRERAWGAEGQRERERERERESQAGSVLSVQNPPTVGLNSTNREIAP